MMVYQLDLRENVKFAIRAEENITRDDIDFVIAWLLRLDLENVFPPEPEQAEPEVAAQPDPKTAS